MRSSNGRPGRHLRNERSFRRWRAFAILLATLLPTPEAHAQEAGSFIPPPPPRTVFVSANAGFLARSQDFIQLSEFPLYGEIGSFEAEHVIKGGPAFDVSAGVRIRGGFAIGLAYSRRTLHTRDAAVNAQVPDPLFTNRLRRASATVTGLEHGERAVHVQALGHVPVTVEFDVTFFAGPTFFTIDEDIVEGITPAEGASGAVTLSAGRGRQRQTALGFHAGIDMAHMFTRHAGWGAMLRYSRGSADLELPPGSVGPPIEVRAGGLELAAGLRLRF